MLHRPLIIILLFLTAILLWWAFESTRPIPGIESKGSAEDWIPWVSLAGSVVSLLTGIVTLGVKVFEIRHKTSRRKRS